MALDLLTFGEALVEIMRPGVGQPLDRPGEFLGPYESGAPFIFAVQAARLGAKAGAICCVGDDAFGRLLMTRYECEGLDPRGLRVVPDHATGIAFIAYAEDGSRDFVFTLKDSAAAYLTPDLLDETLFDGLKCLHVTGSALSMGKNGLATGLRALELAQKAGAKISFDANVRPQLLPPDKVWDVFAPFVDAADGILLTAEEALLLAHEWELDRAVDVLLFQPGKPGRVVVVHDGAHGCILYTDAGDEADFPETMRVEPVEGFDVEEVDPTGAGDSFDAGFLVRWLAGDELYEAARFANACGALAVTKRGPMAGSPTKRQVIDFLALRPETNDWTNE